MSLEQVKAKVHQTQLALKAMGYQPFDIHVEIMQLPKGVAGMANIKLDKIRISSDFLADHENQTFARTIPHEVCHLYVKRYFPSAKQYHGKEFRMLMTRLGADPTTRHDLRLKGAVVKKHKVVRFVYVTETSKEVVHLTKMQHDKACRGAAYRVEGEPIVFDNKVIKL